ncbi:Uma2 family endonuclease [Leptolyngbya cf. ectocarpi LEGE 11479]|uniref:Uma2 family endonuclease n=1 Tax=Leptolyngbya cf. ectocarpi LEGE 11479 TaxID=1828722 RepID=A0A928X1N7_LEPEC|nr:Uma2 family endonuclease [Leptolyngbya ectocarpi]MBE9065929.1 Uma2 family endonuclease [Leptolyngbya cf. ectocarpi LEGE 11479]
MTIATQSLTLETFLELPETKPASEFIQGRILQKPMPQHSLLQSTLCETINQVAKTTGLAAAFPELRCTFGGRSIVPDISVFRWDRIPLTETGRIANRFLIPPDWSIEILSPDQSQTQVLRNLLHCIEHGSELGWLLDPSEDSVLVVDSEQRIQIVTGEAELPMLTDVDLSLTATDVFGWLTLN